MASGLPRRVTNLQSARVPSAVSNSASDVYEVTPRLDYPVSIYFATLKNAAGRRGISSEVKIRACLRLLGTAQPLEDLDDGARMGKETLRRYFRQFCRATVLLYGGEYLNRRPNQVELESIEAFYRSRVFLDVLALSTAP